MQDSMFSVLLRFSDNKDKAGQFMAAHREWITRGFDEGVFLMVGLLQPELGGGILAHNTSLPDLQARISEDPFVVNKVASPEIIEITPSRFDERLQAVFG